LYHADLHSQQKMHEWTSFLPLVNQYLSNAIALMKSTYFDCFFTDLGIIKSKIKITSLKGIEWRIKFRFRD
jgi:hypothetical protein